MAPKPGYYIHQASGRSYRYSSDRRYFVFEDNGERILVPPVPSRRSESEAGPSRQPATTTFIDQPALENSMRNLSVSEYPNTAPAADPSRAASGVDGGVIAWTGEDRQTGIQSNWEFGPRQRETASNVRQPRSYSPKLIRSIQATIPQGHDRRSTKPTIANRGFKGYRRSKDPLQDFATFTVIQILFIIPPPSRLSMITGGPPQPGSSDEDVTHMRRFVIIGHGDRPNLETFKALPIKTYNGEGVGARGVFKSHHAIIYSTKEPPRPLEAERPQKQPNKPVEKGMLQHSIRVKADDRETRLDPKSRLDFFDLYEFDYNHYFKKFGTVHKESRPYLIPQYKAVCTALELSAQQCAPLSARMITSPSLTGSFPPANAAESSHAVSDRQERVIAKLQEFRLFASKRGFIAPEITRTELNELAQDEPSFRTWAMGIKADFEKQMATSASNTAEDNDEDDVDEEDEDEEDEDEEDEDEDKEDESDDDENEDDTRSGRRHN